MMEGADKGLTRSRATPVFLHFGHPQDHRRQALEKAQNLDCLFTALPLHLEAWTKASLYSVPREGHHHD